MRGRVMTSIALVAKSSTIDASDFGLTFFLSAAMQLQHTSRDAGEDDKISQCSIGLSFSGLGLPVPDVLMRRSKVHVDTTIQVRIRTRVHDTLYDDDPCVEQRQYSSTVGPYL